MATHTQSSRTGISSISLPRTKFILQPHHIQILKMMVTLFVASDPRKLPPLYVLNVNRVLLEAVAEIRAPPTYQEIQRKSAVRIAGKVFDVKEMWTLAKEMDSLEGLIQFFAGINKLLDNTKVARRSMFGYFSRRCHLAFMKLSYEGKYKLFEDYQAWINGHLISGAVYMRNDILSRDHILFKSSEDKKEFARPDEYRIWEMSLATGDDLSAAESLRRFFEQRFHEGNDSGLRQHSLLNLARLHYLRHEHVACRKLLEEAVTVARTCNDGQTLQYCISMLNRLQPLERNRKMAINELQPELHPSEALFDVKKLLVVGNQQPLSAAFERIAQATSLYDLWAQNRRDLVTEEEQWGSHAAQSVAWSMMGNNRLADLEEDIVFAFTDVGGSDNNRLTVTLNRAYRYARQGDYEEAISMLLDTNVWQGLDMTDYEQWATQIWNILMLRASRRGQTKMITDYLWPKRFIHGASLKEYTYGAGAPLHSLIRDPLHEVLTMREAGQGHTAIQPLLTSIWHSEFQQRYASYRPGMILLADIGLEFGLTKWCRKIIEEIMPQLISGDDLEQRAYACYTLARCIIAAADDTEYALRESVFYLKIAESDYSTMEMFRSLQDTQYLLSIVYHNLGMQAERDETAARHQRTQKQADEAKQQVTEDWITDVMDLITEVGSALASRTPRWFKEQRSIP